jgi:DNA-binding SARP family transcriptional activator
MDFRILGPVEVIDGGRVPLPRPKQRALLAYLLLHAGEVVSTDRLLDALWGERPPPTATDALQNYVSQLRKALGAAVIVTRPPGYLLNAAPEQIDLGRFRRLTVEARAADDNLERAEKLRAALGLWRGAPLAEREFEFFAHLELQPLLSDHVAAREDLIDAELALGGHAELLGEIESLIEEHPYDERLRGQLALALYRAGRQSDALEALRKTRRLLRDELGLEPEPELRELERAILVQDPSLAVSPRRRATIQPARKTVTIVSAGLVDRSHTRESLDPEALAVLHDRLVGAMRAVAERRGATVRRIVGSGVIAVFGVPSIREEDALQAVHTAVEMREAVAAMPERNELRIGVNSGEVLAHETEAGDMPVTGAPVNVARWLEQTARPGEIVLGPLTLRLVRGAVTAEPIEHRASGTRPPVQAFRLVAIAAGAPAIERHPHAPLVGRVGELAELWTAFEAARDERRCRVVTVIGEAGIGKTRLANELAERIREDATVLVGRCVSYGEGATYLPLREIVAQSGVDLAAVLDGAGSTGEELLALRRHFESVARERPLVLVLEDVHWAEPTLLDLVEYMRDQVSDSPIVLLCLARPELLDERPGWPDTLSLAPLEDAQVRELVNTLAAENAVQAPIGSLIAELAEGNPLFAEQLFAFATEGGALGSVPPTLEGLLASRLDRLAAEERSVLQRAAVVGREFSRAAVVDLSPPAVAPAVDAHLAELVRKRLVEGAVGSSFRFHHVLLRDVAYSSLPKAERADLHERLADQIDGDPDELVGYHLEQAFRYRTEVGPVDPRARRLADDAGARLGAAGMRAWKRGDTPATVNLLGRATDLLPEGDPLCLELLCELGIALRGGGELARAEALLAAAVEDAASTGRRVAELRARLELANVRMFSDPGGRADALLEAADEAIPVFEAVADDRALSRAWRLIAYVEGATRCRYAASSEAAERALTYCVRSGWSTAACLGDLAAALYYGPTPVPKAIRRCRSLLKAADLAGEAHLLAFLAGLEAMRGRFGEARELVDRAEATYEELGNAAFAQGNCGTMRGQIELLAGDPAAAERALRSSYAALESMGDRAYLATRAAELAETVHLNGRPQEAKRWSVIAEEIGGADDIPTQFLWRSVRAKLLALDGETAEAEALAREAVALADGTDALGQRAKITFDLADVLRRCGHADEAAVAADRALGLFEQKGNLVAAKQARALLASLAPA